MAGLTTESPSKQLRPTSTLPAHPLPVCGCSILFLYFFKKFFLKVCTKSIKKHTFLYFYFFWYGWTNSRKSNQATPNTTHLPSQCTARSTIESPNKQLRFIPSLFPHPLKKTLLKHGSWLIFCFVFMAFLNSI